MQKCVMGFAGAQLGHAIRMEEGEGDWKRLEIFIRDIIKDDEV